ncbi:MAG TPA: glycerophosphodiester phosphodiesterase family protein [Luteitalea sp.]|nr:glycerophosphodiester phosphodiesterase family protein [Luteitalea sp.]
MTALPEAAGPPARPWVVAHRGASAYAPENTVPAFELAAAQGATFFELDIQLTKDGEVVCLHDPTLERTTNVEELFPTRAREVLVKGETRKQWPLSDFTLAEIRTLDAGAWFDPKFAGTRIPTFKEAIAAAKGKIGIYVELKLPERYAGIEAKMLADLKAAGLDQPWADPKTPIVLQSFGVASLQILHDQLKTPLPIHLLFGPADAMKWVTDDGLTRAKAFSTGLSPDKQVVRQDPTLVARAQAKGMLVTPYTYRASATGTFADVTAEMGDALKGGIDGLITDNPDKLPKK